MRASGIFAMRIRSPVVGTWCMVDLMHRGGQFPVSCTTMWDVDGGGMTCLPSCRVQNTCVHNTTLNTLKQANTKGLPKYAARHKTYTFQVQSVHVVTIDPSN
jgi:hypothetical protein